MHRNNCNTAANALRTVRVELAAEASVPASEGYFMAPQRRSSGVDTFVDWFSHIKSGREPQ